MAANCATRHATGKQLSAKIRAVRSRAPSCTVALKSVSMRSVLVSVVIPDPGLRIFQTLLIPSLGNQVEVLVGGIHHIDAPRVARVGVKNRAALVLIEDADALTVHHAGVHSCIVEERRSTLDFLRGKGGLIVKVEIALERGDPLEAPSHALFEQLDLGKRGPRNGHKAHITMREVNAAPVERVGPERAVRTPFVILGWEHKVINDELAPLFEELGQRLFAIGSIEDIRLVHLHPWELPPLPAQFVSKPCEFLFLRKKRRARGEPLLARNHPVVLDTTAGVVCHTLTSVLQPIIFNQQVEYIRSQTICQAPHKRNGGLTKGSASSIFHLMVEYTDTLDKTFHALAHPIRREMLARLTHKRFTVLEMAQLFDLSLNGVSKHLKVLEQAGLIQREIQGRTHYCSLEAERLREAAEWLDYYRHFWEGRLDALESFLEKKKNEKTP